MKVYKSVIRELVGPPPASTRITSNRVFPRCWEPTMLGMTLQAVRIEAMIRGCSYRRPTVWHPWVGRDITTNHRNHQCYLSPVWWFPTFLELLAIVTHQCTPWEFAQCQHTTCSLVQPNNELVEPSTATPKIFVTSKGVTAHMVLLAKVPLHSHQCALREACSVLTVMSCCQSYIPSPQ